nr:MAG TPA: hypothetical protein [Caudoviricetes sp.]
MLSYSGALRITNSGSLGEYELYLCLLKHNLIYKWSVGGILLSLTNNSMFYAIIPLHSLNVNDGIQRGKRSFISGA